MAILNDVVGLILADDNKWHAFGPGGAILDNVGPWDCPGDVPDEVLCFNDPGRANVRDVYELTMPEPVPEPFLVLDNGRDPTIGNKRRRRHRGRHISRKC